MARADVSLPNIFGDHMVLQQQHENRVWGKAAPGEQVTVSIGDQAHKATAGDDGNWQVSLRPLPVGGPYELNVQGNNKVTVSDVLVGEVWICSGQSNMEWRVNNSNDPDMVKAAANYPTIRMINYPNTGSQEPIWTHEGVDWMVCSPETVGEFSAVGYFFGRQLQNTLGDVPIGLINNSWGGSACDAWINRDLLTADESYKPTLDRWRGMEAQYEELAAVSEPNEQQERQLNGLRRQMRGNHRPANIYNGVLKSHLGYGIKGAIWYQGESNASRAYQYREMFPLMIQNWRDVWQQGDFPFYFVQLADFRDESADPQESDWAELREAQTMTLAKLPNTGQAVITDLGEAHDIHPKDKQNVAKRLARWALAKDYGIGIPYRSPEFKSAEVKGNRIIVTLDHVGGGLDTFDVRRPVGLAVAGEDKVFKWAEGKIVGKDRIEVWSTDVASPVAVRYAWADNPVCNLQSREGLPVTPFRSDDWPGVTANVHK